jgi:hypothetical protein
VDIDNMDFSILKTIADADGPLWKKQVHRRIQNRLQTLPASDSVSVQTIGRRIDRLKEDGYLAPCIVRPEGINRDLIIAFETTETGRNAVYSQQDDLLREYTADALLRDSSPDYGHDTAAALAADELGRDTVDQLRQHTPKCLAAALCYHYLAEELDGLEEAGQTLRSLLADGTAPGSSIPVETDGENH